MNPTRTAVTAVAIAAVLATSSFAAGTRLGQEDVSPSLERLVQAAERIQREAAEPVSEAELVQGAIRGMLGALEDPYAGFLDAEQARHVDDLVSGSFVGIGVWLEATPRGLRITSVIEDSPAERAGLEPGEVIVEAAGHPLDGVDIDRAARFLRGPEGSTVRLVVASDGGDRAVVVRRARVTMADVQARMVGGKVAYAHPLQFGRGVARRLRTELSALLDRGARAIVLDLRGNRGGLADEAVRTASLFLDGGVVARIRERGRAERSVTADGASLATDVPMAVLVDGGTASASELVVGALKDRGRATVVGTETFGKGSVLSVDHLAGSESAIQFTTAFFLTPGGHRIEGRGITPDIEVLPGGPHDAQLDRAVAVVLGRE